MNLFFTLLFTSLIFIFSCKNPSQHDGANHNSNEPIAAADKKYQSNLHLLPNKKYAYTITTETSTNIEANDKKIETDNKSEIGIVYELVKDSAGTSTVKLTYTKLHMVIKKTDDDDKVIDSDTPADEQTPVDKLLSTIKGSTILLTLNAKGDIVSNSGSKEIANKIMAGMINDDPKMKQLVQQLLSKLTGDGFIQENLKEGFKLLPDTAVYIGDSWNRKSIQNTEMSFESAAKYTLDDVDNNVAAIKMEGQINSAKNAPATISGQQVTADLKGEQSGNFKTDLTTGMLQSGKTNASIKGTITVMGRELPISIKIKKQIIQTAKE